MTVIFSFDAHTGHSKGGTIHFSQEKGIKTGLREKLLAAPCGDAPLANDRTIKRRLSKS